MKGTFDDGRIDFKVIFMDNDKTVFNVNFSDLYGLGVHTFLEYYKYNNMALLTEVNTFSKVAQVQEAFFKDIKPSEDDLTFEDTITNYLTNPINYENFDDVQKIHALCFLERYSMNYEKTNDIKKKYVKKK